MSNTYTPENCNTLNIYLIVDDGKAAVDFYQKAFGGQLGEQLDGPDGSVMHAAIRIGNSTLMLTQANAQWGTQSPKDLGGSPAMIHLYVSDADAAFQQAIEHGCQEVAAVDDFFWGERMGKVTDPFGFQWGLATKTEHLTAEEVHQRGEEWMKKNNFQ